MNLLQKTSSLRIIFFAMALLCVLLAAEWAQDGASHELLRKKPSVDLQVSKKLLTYPCPPGMYSSSRACLSADDLRVFLTAVTRDFSKRAAFVYTVSGGRIVGEGSKVTWDLSEAGPGIYAATLEVQDNKKHRALATVNVTVQNCGDCVHEEPCPMPMAVTCYDEVKAGTPITCKVVMGRAIWRAPAAYEWSARDSNGEDASERISVRDTYISIRTDGLGGRYLTTTVRVKGLDPSCSPTASASTAVKP
jgi:hypothetical protein